MSDPRDGFVDLRGLQFHYRDWGGQGRPLVLLHGLASTAHIWDLVAPALVPAYRVVALDQRGHGESAKPEAGYDFATIGDDLAAFLAALALARPVLVGHSWGGHVALSYAARWAQAPEHPAAPAGLVLVDGGFMDLQARFTWEQAERELAPPDLSSYTLAALVTRLQRGDLGRCWSPAVERIVLANFTLAPDGTVRPRLSRANHLRILRALWELRPQTLYPAVRCPVLLAPAVRDDDPRGPGFTAARRAAVAAAAAALPAAEISWFTDTIHDIPLQRPSELASAIARFAARLPV
jgi:pimeloyl-ACP methyl ester carboxylesterase